MLLGYTLVSYLLASVNNSFFFFFFRRTVLKIFLHIFHSFQIYFILFDWFNLYWRNSSQMVIPGYLVTIMSCCCCVASVVSDSVRPHRQQPTRHLHPWDSPGKNTGVGCHFLLQCMKVRMCQSDVTERCGKVINKIF